MTSINLQQQSSLKSRFSCPHCGLSHLQIRSSKQQHPLLKLLYLQCTNVKCGFTCQAHFEIKTQLSPSGQPNPEVKIPSIKRLDPKVSALKHLESQS